MSKGFSNIAGGFALSSVTATAGTAFATLVPPYRGAKSPEVDKVEPSSGYKLVRDRHYTHLTQLVYTAAGTAHDVVVMRPLNYSHLTADVAANGTVLNLAADPGAYSTAFKYPLPGGVTKPACTADNGIAGSDYVALQLKDGTWHTSLVTSVSSLAVTLTTALPNITDGGALKFTPVYFFGVAANVDPRTGQAHLKFTSVASTRVNLLHDVALGTVPNLFPGDPMLIYSANAAAAGTLNIASGFYAAV